MIGLRSATAEDKLHLQKCFSLDEWHAKEHVENWLAADVTTFFDERGALLHMAFAMEGETLRLHAQFDPLAKMRTARGVPEVLKIIKCVAGQNGYTRLAFWSMSPSLIGFMARLGFIKSGEDYALDLVETGDAPIRAECPTDH